MDGRMDGGSPCWLTGWLTGWPVGRLTDGRSGGRSASQAAGKPRVSTLERVGAQLNSDNRGVGRRRRRRRRKHCSNVRSTNKLTRPYLENYYRDGVRPRRLVRFPVREFWRVYRVRPSDFGRRR